MAPTVPTARGTRKQALLQAGGKRCFMPFDQGGPLPDPGIEVLLSGAHPE
ncbi:hypothetical protein [Streptacidiphilus albus]|nr:hypothetical protein [Streptacidiphilus albus]